MHVLIPLILGACFAPAAHASANSSMDTLLWILGILSVLQAVMIGLLQKSRLKYKAARKALKRAKDELENRVQERTDSLRDINSQLSDTLARREIAEELLKETQDYLHSIINSMPSVLIGVSRSGHITLWNAAAERQIGVSSRAALGQIITDIYEDLPINLSLVEAAIDQQLPQTLENLKQGQGSHATFSDITVYPLVANAAGGAVIRIDDVTLRVRVENMMIQNEKMLSLGELAAGMAHEINNPLAAILSNIQNVQRRTDMSLKASLDIANEMALDPDTFTAYWHRRELPKLLAHVREAGERASRIVNNMLEFSRSHHRDHAATHIPTLLDNSLELAINSMQLDMGDEITLPKIEKHYQPALPPLTCSAVEIQQVVLNLLRNAFQAFTHADYGAPDNPTIKIFAETDGDWFLLRFVDNGPGMPETVRRHIFEPFYTTKDVGQGTGLGLSVSYFIVTEHHGGTIHVDSTPGQGTEFSIRLPKA